MSRGYARVRGFGERTCSGDLGCAARCAARCGDPRRKSRREALDPQLDFVHEFVWPPVSLKNMAHKRRETNFRQLITPGRRVRAEAPCCEKVRAMRGA